MRDNERHGDEFFKEFEAVRGPPADTAALPRSHIQRAFRARARRFSSYKKKKTEDVTHRIFCYNLRTLSSLQLENLVLILYLPRDENRQVAIQILFVILYRRVLVV